MVRRSLVLAAAIPLALPCCGGVRRNPSDSPAERSADLRTPAPAPTKVALPAPTSSDVPENETLALRMIARSHHRINLFAADTSVLLSITQQKQTGLAGPLRFFLVNRESCADLGPGPETFTAFGVVNLNTDPEARWGHVPGVNGTWHGYRNAGFRTLVGAGVGSDGVPWALLQTDAGHPALDLYSSRGTHWEKGPGSIRDESWVAVASRKDAPGLVGVRRVQHSVYENDFLLGLFPSSDSAISRDLTLGSGWLSNTSLFIESFSEAVVVVSGAAELPVSAIQIATSGDQAVVRGTSDIRVGPALVTNALPQNPETAGWGVRFLSTEQFEVWRRGKGSQSCRFGRGDGPLDCSEGSTIDASMRLVDSELGDRITDLLVLADGTLVATAADEKDQIVWTSSRDLAPCDSLAGGVLGALHSTSALSSNGGK